MMFHDVPAVLFFPVARSQIQFIFQVKVHIEIRTSLEVHLENYIHKSMYYGISIHANS